MINLMVVGGVAAAACGVVSGLLKERVNLGLSDSDIKTIKDVADAKYNGVIDHLVKLGVLRETDEGYQVKYFTTNDEDDISDEKISKIINSLEDDDDEDDDMNVFSIAMPDDDIEKKFMPSDMKTIAFEIDNAMFKTNDILKELYLKSKIDRKIYNLSTIITREIMQVMSMLMTAYINEFADGISFYSKTLDKLTNYYEDLYDKYLVSVEEGKADENILDIIEKLRDNVDNIKTLVGNYFKANGKDLVWFKNVAPVENKPDNDDKIPVEKVENKPEIPVEKVEEKVEEKSVEKPVEAKTEEKKGDKKPVETKTENKPVENPVKTGVEEKK